MRKINLIVLAMLAIYLLAAPLALGQGGNPPASTKESGATSGKGMTAVEQTGKGGGKIEEQIETLEAEFVQAELKGDASALEKFYADDATIIHSTGTLSTKAQEIENLKSGALKYDVIEVRDRKIRVYGDTAVVNAEASVKGIIDGKPFSVNIRATRMWVKQNGGWKVISFQITRMAPPASQ